MKKYFNIAGPCISNEHYMLPSIERNCEIASLIEQKQYFVIHAARQTGKTTLLHQLVDDISEKGKYYALYCSLESVQPFSDHKDGIPGILSIIRKIIRYSNLPGKSAFAKNAENESVSTMLNIALTDFCIELDKPLIIFFDEVDCLSNGTLITFLRQLRDGYVSRNRIPFLHSVALVGMRNIRDYKSKIREGRETLGSASPFNIITKTLRLNNFTLNEVENLYEQHTNETGQIFEKETVEKVYYYTQGQPWLVNAIAREIIVEILKNDYSKNITHEFVEQAAENIMIRRDTHIDSLLERL
ncbi:MAG: AAA-like domain-containing protein, partial [Bacteroidia bacterium]|nr:AAA-like domain-containing protein [Bacteroidia bacterium]